AKKQFTNTVGEYTFLYWKQKDDSGNLLDLSDDSNNNPFVEIIGSENVKRKLIIEDTLTPINKQYYAIYDINYFDKIIISGKKDNNEEIQNPKLYIEDSSKFSIENQYATKNLLDGEFLNTSVKDIWFDNSGNKYIFKHWEDISGDLVSDDITSKSYTTSSLMEFKKRNLNVLNDNLTVKHYIAVYDFIAKDKNCVLDFESYVNNINNIYDQPSFKNVFNTVGTSKGCWNNSERKRCSTVLNKGELFQISAKQQIIINNKLYVFDYWSTENGNKITYNSNNPKLLDDYTLQFNYLYDKPYCIPMLSEKPSLTYIGKTVSDTLYTSDTIINNENKTRFDFIEHLLNVYNISQDIIYETYSSDIKSLTDTIQYHVINNSDHIVDYLNIIYISDMQEGNNEYEWWNRITDEMDNKEFQLNIYILRILGNTETEDSINTLEYFTDFGNQKPEYVNIFTIDTVHSFPQDHEILDALFNKNKLLCTCPDGKIIIIDRYPIECVETTDNDFSCVCSDGSEIMISGQDVNNTEEASVLASTICQSEDMSDAERICKIKPYDPICGKYIANYRFEIVDCQLIFASELNDGIIPEDGNVFNTVGTFTGCWKDTDDSQKKCYKDLYPNEKFTITAQQYFTYDEILYEFDYWLGPNNLKVSETTTTNAIRFRHNKRTIDFDNNGDLLCGDYVAIYKKVGWVDPFNCSSSGCSLKFYMKERIRYKYYRYKCKYVNGRWRYVHYRSSYSWRNSSPFGNCYRRYIKINGTRTTCWSRCQGCTGDYIDCKYGHKLEDNSWLCVRRWEKGQDIDVSVYNFGGRSFKYWIGKNIQTKQYILDTLQQKRLNEDPNDTSSSNLLLTRSPYIISSSNSHQNIKFFGSEYDVTGIYFCRYNITPSGRTINHIRGIDDILSFYNSITYFNDDMVGIVFYENFRTGNLYLIINLQGALGNADIQVSGVPVDSDIVTNNAIKNDNTITGSYSWNNNSVGLIIGNIEDFSNLSISVTNFSGLNNIKFYSTKDKKIYSSANIIQPINDPEIITYTENELDLSYYLTHYDYDSSNFKTYNYNLIFINGSSEVTVLDNQIFDIITKCGWIRKTENTHYQITNINKDNNTISIDRNFEETSSGITGDILDYHQHQKLYWFENGSNIVKCNTYESVTNISIGTKIYSETDNNEIYSREVIDRVIIHDPLIPDLNYEETFHLVLDDNYNGTSTLSECGERIYFQKPQYELSVISDLKGVVVSEPGSIYADEASDTQIYNSGIVTLYAHPKIGYYLKSWKGDASGNNNPLIVNVNK
ncbi:MAG: hypothetical protein ACOC2W_02855, partial [bacterium]